ncbi:DUF3572 domain-containing protein [Sulfitobacter sp. D35]|uniref:DUF3572 domain-containing protein n=1 Tax=Sulfitobacter sp. D35 TaxID=3083252 RepID=UPI00296EE272|nr:DUF3572 domain-containing protein [Sulfitobacter sp. D35]MDW4496616.1 DUF3572 domain-containing protein [Sulfitobacter sp. D35]
MTLSRSAAETTALHVLGWLVGEEDMLPVFLGSTGASEADLRAGAADPMFLGAVLDFILLDDAWVRRACEALQMPFETIAAARQALPGGDQVHWT